MPLVIPASIEPASTAEPQTVAFYGDQKIGKSETVAKLGLTPAELLHIDTHEGTNFIATRRVRVASLSEWLELCGLPITPNASAPAVSPLLAAWRAHPFRFLAIDVLDDVEAWALETAEANYRRMPVGRNFGGVSILELDMGLGYGYMRDAFLKLIQPVWGGSRWTTIFIIHSRAKFLGATVAPTEAVADQIDLTGKVRKMICNKVDAVGHFTKNANGQLQLSFQTKEKVICGLRARYLHNQMVAFSDPAKPEEWAKVWPTTWNKPAAVEVLPPAPPVAPAAAKPAVPMAPAPVKPPVAAPAPAIVKPPAPPAKP